MKPKNHIQISTIIIYKNKLSINLKILFVLSTALTIREREQVSN